MQRSKKTESGKTFFEKKEAGPPQGGVNSASLPGGGSRGGGVACNGKDSPGRKGKTKVQILRPKDGVYMICCGQ